jgi:hypothetical protein
MSMKIRKQTKKLNQIEPSICQETIDIKVENPKKHKKS